MSKHDKSTEQEALIDEIDKSSKELELVVGNIMYGKMTPDEATEWLEYESSEVVDTLEKAREYIEEHTDK
ncbi:hypothetical protein I6N90_08215 [Paenibacillus sp. GSMTC-2017]|uniref:hypothetical protein n=1 Tax=Paenibacillus sp. GSMTC-2017 TaxID=2794350 RepID=UPI0018D97D1B|nr:hypothetical protein [Paenibacillus sp. GSMTC-2017]MBH5317787.1 hypothetical protein [Paenibacillus sp. GSMTC-2017]